MAKKKPNKKESRFQHEVIRELEERLPGCVVMKNATGLKDGFPDISVYHGNHWAMLECKRSEGESHRPNQDWWVDHLNEMSFASFIYPENRQVVMQQVVNYLSEAEQAAGYSQEEEEDGHELESAC